MAKKRGQTTAMKDIHLYVSNVESLTLRGVDREGKQAELFIRTRSGVLGIRLIPADGSGMRMMDLRARDRGEHRRKAEVQIPWSDDNL